VELGFTFGSVRSPQESKQRVRGERAETKTKVKRCGLDPLAVVSAGGDGFFEIFGGQVKMTGTRGLKVTNSSNQGLDCR
jgi:hypothetical protein